MNIRLLLLAGFMSGESASGVATSATTEVAMTLHTYEARIRLNGKVSTTQIQASSANHCKQLVQAQFGPSVTVLSVKRVD